jgi:hypothetical protein
METSAPLYCELVAAGAWYFRLMPLRIEYETMVRP